MEAPRFELVDDDAPPEPKPLLTPGVTHVALAGALNAGGIYCMIVAAVALVRGMPHLAIAAAVVQGLVYVNCSALIQGHQEIASWANVVAIAVAICIGLSLLVYA